LFSPFAEAYTQRRWSRLKGRSSSFAATTYCRSSGPMRSSRKRAWPITGKLRVTVCRFCSRSCTAVATTGAATAPSRAPRFTRAALPPSGRAHAATAAVRRRAGPGAPTPPTGYTGAVTGPADLDFPDGDAEVLPTFAVHARFRRAAAGAEEAEAAVREGLIPVRGLWDDAVVEPQEPDGRWAVDVRFVVTSVDGERAVDGVHSTLRETGLVPDEVWVAAQLA
jgi:hypothetical protein